METATTPTTVVFTRHVSAAWARWTQRHPQANAGLLSAELQAQYELLAAGVAAALTDEQLQSIWRDEEQGAGETIWTLLLPLQQRYEEERELVHFLMVVVAELLTLGGETLTQGSVRDTARALWLVETLVMPVIKSRTYQRLHAITIELITQLVNNDRVAALLSERVFAALMANEDGDNDGDDVTSYASLCRVCENILQSTDAFVRIAELNEQIQSVCLLAIDRFDRQPRFLRAVSVHLMPALIESQPAAIEILVKKAIGTWQSSASAAAVAAAGPKMRATSRPAQGAFTGSQVCNLLYMLCLLLPKDPTMIGDVDLQKLIAFALTHEDPLLRKQALHLLKIAFSHYAKETAATTTMTTSAKELEIWQSFILASDVIQLHHEPHLLEQVWPQVDHLFQLMLLVPSADQQDTDSSATVVTATTAEETTTTTTTPLRWPVKFTFPWMQSLLMRVFRHENPVVRRMFLTNFMEACVAQFSKPQWNVLDQQISGVPNIHGDSFMADPVFEQFVFQRVLSACNDPLMYKSSRRETFQAVITQFFASFLAFKMAVLPQPQLLNTFAMSACTAVFGPGTDVHSPEAIMSSLRAFEDPQLQQIATNQVVLARVVDPLDGKSLEMLRFVLDTYVLRSFPFSVHTKLLQSFQHALTRGFTCHEALSINCVARTLTIFPLNHLALHHGQALVEIQLWLRKSDAFRGSLSDGIKAFLSGRQVDTTDSSFSNSSNSSTQQHQHPLTAAQLARLLLFTSDTQTVCDGAATATPRLVLQHAVTDLVGDVSLFDGDKAETLLVMLGALEDELAGLGASVYTGVGMASKPDGNAPIAFRPQSFYSGQGLSCESLFQLALQRLDLWLLSAAAAATNPLGSEKTATADEPEEDQLEHQQQMLAACATVATQVATFIMEEQGDLVLIHPLSDLCDRIKVYLSQVKVAAQAAQQQQQQQQGKRTAGDAKQHLQNQAVALRVLSIISSQHLALDALDAFHPQELLPLLSGSTIDRAGITNSSRYISDCLFLFASSKWRVIYNVLQASTYVATKQLRAILQECVDALFSAGSDPSMLTDMVHVLTITLARIGDVLIQEDADHGVSRLNEIFLEIWSAYGYALPKPDALSRAVVVCLFQPAFLRRKELVEGNDSLMKKWFRTLVTFGHIHRPNVVFHLACRLTQIWRVAPQAALPFVDEIVELLVYREPLIADKQKSSTVPAAGHVMMATATTEDGGAGGRVKPPAVVGNAVLAKSRFVRFVVLSFLDEITLDEQQQQQEEEEDATHLLLHKVLRKLLDSNFIGDGKNDWNKQQMLNSDAFGKRLRTWQALTVLSKHITSKTVVEMSVLIWRAFEATQLPVIRFYMEVLGMRLAMRFPQVTIHGYVLPMLGNFNLTPQVGASVLLITGFFINHTMVGDDQGPQDHMAVARSLLEALLPWLNASHGHTRVMVQFLLGVLLPRYLHHLESAQSISMEKSSELVFFQAIARYLSENKETKRMFRRQTKQFDTFQPEFQCTMLGLLSSAGLNEFNELLPDEDAVSLSAQLKETMNLLYEQFQREHFAYERSVKEAKRNGGSGNGALAKEEELQTPSSSASKMINVQRKIDTSAVLLDESVLPVAMRERDELVELNIRQKKRQHVILCATLVDKVPNLAGLARTCEIFNAQKLIVPSLRVCDDEVFQTISVTANKWIPMEQVKEDALVQALTQWKQDGYTIVAVEQTASSKCLSTFQFPEKIVILLGKEKEGIPVDVLQIVDVCVEIPQFGLIRSLNVHVSGAILLWEYTQQQLMNNTTGQQ